MDPLSVSAACVSLTATITKTSISVTNFVRSVRAARNELDAVSRELASLKTLLELIAEDAEDVENFPETLRKHITGILANCELVLVEVQRLVDKYSAPGIIKGSKWALSGSEDVTKLRLSLEAHKSALEIALEMVTLSVTKQIKADTTDIRAETTAIKQDTTNILQEIARLRAQLPDDLATLRPSFQELDTNLARYLNDLTSYAETVCWSGEDSDTDDEEKNVTDAKEKEAKLATQRAEIEAARERARHLELRLQELDDTESLGDEAPQDTTPQKNDPETPSATMVQKETQLFVSQTPYPRNRKPVPSSPEPQQAQREIPVTGESTTFNDRDCWLILDQESEEPPRTKVPPAFKNHISDLESRLKSLQSQRSIMENRVKSWPRQGPIYADGQMLTKQMCEEELVIIRRDENDIGWTLHQAKREREKKDPTPVSDAWFRKVMGEPNKKNLRPNTDEVRSDPTSANVHDSPKMHIDVDDEFASMKRRAAKVARDKTYRSEDPRCDFSPASVRYRKLGATQPNTTLPSSPSTMPQIPRRLSEEAMTLAMQSLELERHAGEKRANGVTTVPNIESSENKAALVQPARVFSPRNEHTYVQSTHGTWDIGLLIRKGARGYITDAKHKETKAQVYLKVYKCNLATTDKRIAREVAINSVLWHRNILGIYACVRSDSHWYLQIPFTQKSLAAELQFKRPLSILNTKVYAAQIGSALAYCHAHGIVHLNLDVTKVLIDDYGTIRVAGFGQIVTPSGALPRPGPRHSHPGLITLDDVQRKYESFQKSWLPAPEVLRRPTEFDADWRKADVWSFGIIIWMMSRNEAPTKIELSKKLQAAHTGSRLDYLLSLMLREDFRSRISVEQVNQSAWMTYNGQKPSIESFVPWREPLKLPLNPLVAQELTKSGVLGPFLEAKDIEHYIQGLISSERYREAVAEWQSIQSTTSDIGPIISTRSRRNFFGRTKYETVVRYPVPIDKSFCSRLYEIDELGYMPLYYLFQERLQRQDRQKAEDP